ncbi:MAG: serine hydrolase family protein [Candidatus Pacebacteria bacterium]|nr:serine hydrolase family protein [Candidatus Paceibacterota bacterium]
MKKVFMVHGFQGEPNGGWRPWLMGKLARMDIWACALSMPTPAKPLAQEWVNKIASEVGQPDDETFLVGHSLGVPAVLRYLDSLPDGANFGGALLASGFARKIEDDTNDDINNFAAQPFNFEHIKKVCKNFVVVHGDNDSSVPFEHAAELSKSLNCKLITIPNGGHLNGSSGWHELPEALEALTEMMK